MPSRHRGHLHARAWTASTSSRGAAALARYGGRSCSPASPTWQIAVECLKLGRARLHRQADDARRGTGAGGQGAREARPDAPEPVLPAASRKPRSAAARSGATRSCSSRASRCWSTRWRPRTPTPAATRTRVARYAVKTAVQLGYTGDLLEQIRLGGELHDIGKIGTREDILNKPGPLTPEEFQHIKEHTAARARRSWRPRWRGSRRWCSGSCGRTTSGSTAPAFRTASPGDAIPHRGAHRRGGRRLRRDDHQPRLPAVPVARPRPATSSGAAPARTSTPRWSRPSCAPSPTPPAPDSTADRPQRARGHPMSDTLMISVSGMRGIVGTDLTPGAGRAARGGARRLGAAGAAGTGPAACARRWCWAATPAPAGRCSPGRRRRG